MITFILGLVSAVLLLLLLWIGSAGGFAFWLMQVFKRPGVLIFYPGGRAVLRPLAKDEDQHSHIELKKEGLAYLKETNIIRLNDSVSVYLVYAPLGKNIRPEYIGIMDVIQDEGYETYADFVRDYVTTAEQAESAHKIIKDAMRKYKVTDASRLVDILKEKGATPEELQKITSAINVLSKYRKLSEIMSKIEPLVKTMDPEAMRPLASTISADYIHRLLANARTEARISMLEEIQKLLKNRHTEVILGLIVLAIIVVVLVLNPGGGGQAVTQVAQSAAQKVVEANVGGGIHM